jgi:hypothetical protein
MLSFIKFVGVPGACCSAAVTSSLNPNHIPEGAERGSTDMGA